MSDTMTQCHHIFFEQELPYRGDHVMVEATREYELLGPWEEEGYRPYLCNPVYLFRVFAYNELTENYEVPISDQLTEDENFQFTKLIHEARCDEAIAYAESRGDRD